MTSGVVVLSAFDTRMRTELPPSETRATSRTVALDGVALPLLACVLIGAPQAAIHRPPCADAVFAEGEVSVERAVSAGPGGVADRAASAGADSAPPLGGSDDTPPPVHELVASASVSSEAAT